MFTDYQLRILQVLASTPEHSITLAELGRLIGKAPGVFQRGLNALEAQEFITSHRKANLRLLSINTEHPLHEAIRAIALYGNDPLPGDVYMRYDRPDSRNMFTLAEPPGTYTTAPRKLLIIAGPNGAGKTTFAREYLPREGACHVFINADYIAHALSPFSPERAALKAGRIMISELDDHLAHQRNVALETTLSGRRYARLIPRWQAEGYAVKLIFLSLPSVDLALARVASRVRQGGHAIPEPTVRRRFEQGLLNFNRIYTPLVDAWAHYDNSGPQPTLIKEEEK